MLESFCLVTGLYDVSCQYPYSIITFELDLGKKTGKKENKNKYNMTNLIIIIDVDLLDHHKKQNKIDII